MNGKNDNDVRINPIPLGSRIPSSHRREHFTAGDACRPFFSHEQAHAAATGDRTVDGKTRSDYLECEGMLAPEIQCVRRCERLIARVAEELRA